MPHRALNLIKREVSRNPLQSSKEVLEGADVSGIPKTSRCRILKRLTKCGKANIRPPLKDKHKKKRLEWAEKYIKMPFEYVLFADECRGEEVGFPQSMDDHTFLGVSREAVVLCFRRGLLATSLLGHFE